MRLRRWFFTTASCKPWIALLALLLSGGVCARPVSAIDDRGKEVVLPQAAQRIIALAPNLTELAFAAGAGERLIGVSAFSDYPAAARKLPQIGSYGKADRERLLQLRPDLVIAWHSGNAAGDLAFLENLGIPLYITEARQLDDIPRHIEAIGRLAGVAEQAEQAAAAFRLELGVLRKRYAAARPVRIFYEIWHQPLMTVNDRHLIGEAVRLCGGENVFAALPSINPVISLESLLAADPQVIVSGGHAGLWRRYPQLAAVRNEQVFSLDPDLLLRATPRTLTGARQLCEMLERTRR